MSALAFESIQEADNARDLETKAQLYGALLVTALVLALVASLAVCYFEFRTHMQIKARRVGSTPLELGALHQELRTLLHYLLPRTGKFVERRFASLDLLRLHTVIDDLRNSARHRIGKMRFDLPDVLIQALPQSEKSDPSPSSSYH